MKFKFLFPVVVLFLTVVKTNGQTCILDIGSKNSETIKTVFQLNEEQIKTLEALKEAVKTELDVQELEVKNLFENHPQSTPDELLILAKKHKVLEDKMIAITVSYDQKLISLFNQKQYERYQLLCESAKRSPIVKLEE
jgi:ubiquinone/menaquinone biosynthesis C-methylase UbiE